MLYQKNIHLCILLFSPLMSHLFLLILCFCSFMRQTCAERKACHTTDVSKRGEDLRQSHPELISALLQSHTSSSPWSSFSLGWGRRPPWWLGWFCFFSPWFYIFMFTFYHFIFTLYIVPFCSLKWFVMRLLIHFFRGLGYLHQPWEPEDGLVWCDFSLWVC